MKETIQQTSHIRAGKGAVTYKPTASVNSPKEILTPEPQYSFHITTKVFKRK